MIRSTLFARINFLAISVAFVANAALADRPDPGDCTDPEYGSLSMDEIVQLLIPDYEAKIANWRNGGVLGETVEYAGASISEAIQTDFGAPGYHFVLASYDASTGSCAQCVESGLGIIDTDARRLVWSIGGEDNPGGIAIENLEVTQLSAFDRFDGFAFRWTLGGRFHDTEIWEERIYHPNKSFPNNLDFYLAWAGLLKTGCGISCFAMPQQLCGTMVHDDQSDEWTYRATSLYGTRPVSWYHKRGSPDVENEGTCDDDRYPVAFFIEERWRFDGQGNFAQVFSSDQRLDRGETTTFPFQLPKRALRKRVEKIQKSKHSNATDVARDDWGVLSPSEKLLLTGNRKRSGETLELRDRKTKAIIRSISMGKAPAPEIDEVGWSTDEKRLYLTIRFGFEDRRALISFSATGTDDWWERSLPPGSAPSSVITGRVMRRSVKRTTSPQDK